MKKLATLAALSVFALAASAQDPVGVLQQVDGAVSLSGPEVVSQATSGTPVSDGASILVSSTGKATLLLNNGCTVHLQRNQFVTVNAKAPCEETVASVQTLFPAYQVAQAPLGSGLTPPPAGDVVSESDSNAQTVALLFAGAVGIAAIAGGSGSSTPISGQ